MLRGLKPPDWKRIRQIVLEVHDTNGRLQSVLSLLRRHGFTTTTEQQGTEVVEGYATIVPKSLRLYYLYATRRQGKRKRT